MPSLRAVVPDGVVFEDYGDRLTLVARRDLTGIGSGVFSEPAVYAEVDLDEIGEHVELVGFSFAQFAMPVRASTTRPFEWNPAPNVHSPPAVIPLVLRVEGRICLLAPLDSWHEQIVSVQQDENGVRRLRWGWHGDLAETPAGKPTSLGIYEGESVEACFSTWGRFLRSRNPVERPDRDHPLRSFLSYWTDNGAAYWYRTEPGLDMATTLERKLDELSELGVKIGAVELDSWFYPHEIGREVTEIGYLDEVPATGMIEWRPRNDVLPSGLEGLSERLGGVPLVLHSRHISPQSPYIENGEWWIELAAHPADPSFFEQWFRDAHAAGSVCVEQDWMLMSWFGVRELRARPGRAVEWLEALNAAAANFDMVVLWCMSTPGDLMASVGLDRVVAVRTADDYRYAEDPARLWRWYLTVNRMASALEIPVFKDCFFTSTEPGMSGLDGDPHAEVESVLAAFSAGVVGIGDRLGCTDPTILQRLCLPDGTIATSDLPVALADVSFFGDDGSLDLTWAEARIGDWRYVLALQLSTSVGTVNGTFELGEERLVYNWRTGEAQPATSINAAVGHRGWALFVACPLTRADDGDERALVGDPTRYATMAGIDPSARDHGPDRPILAWSARAGLHYQKFSER